MKRMSAIRPVLLAVALMGPLSALVSCSTTGGSLYSSSVSKDEAAAAEARRRAEERRKAAEASKPGPGNGNTDPSPVTPRPDQPSSSWDREDSSSADLVLNLVFETARAVASGRLDLRGLPPGAEVKVDGSVVASLSGGGSVTGLRLDPGLHLVEVEAFGWKDWSGR